MSKAFILSEMTWPETQEALVQVELAIVPVGSFEQHGPYMTFTVDSERANGFSKLLGERLYPRVIVAPPITFGISHHHMAFPGTITLRHETFHSVIYDMVWSLREHGIKQFFLVNGHGGNDPSLDVMIVRLRRELGVYVAWANPTILASQVNKTRLHPESGGHCGQGETSQSMYLAPQVVRRERIVAGAVKGYPYKWVGRSSGGVNYPYNWDEITDNGALGDATLASEELGREIIDAALNKASEFLTDFMDKNASSVTRTRQSYPR